MSVTNLKNHFEEAYKLVGDQGDYVDEILAGMGLETDDFEIFVEMGMPQMTVTALMCGVLIGRMSFNVEVEDD